MTHFASILSQRKTLLWLSAVFIAAGVLFLSQPVTAGVGEVIATLLGHVILLVVQFLGSILLLLIEILIGVFRFTEFIDTPAVQLGWVVMRDLADVAIVVALIIIAFSTVFRIQRYAAGQLLVRLIIAAFLVNFSLLIAGLLIDFGQVIMMTFVNEFENLAAGNLTAGFGVEEMLTVAKSNVNVGGGGVLEGASGLIAALLLAVVLLLVACVVVLVMIFVLLQRIVYLWILAIFSPVAWVAPLLPGGASYSSQWWSTFTKQVFIGPMLAFGFWLSMSVLSGLTAQQSLISLKIQNTDPSIQGSEEVSRFVSEVSTPQAVFDFMVTIALLLGTLAMAKQAGGAAASFAGSMSTKLQGAGTRLARAPFKGATAVGKFAGRQVVGSKPVQGGIGLAKGLTQRTLKTVGLDEASRARRKRETEIVKARGYEAGAGQELGAGAVRAARFRGIQERVKELQEKGELENEGTIREALRGAHKSGDRLTVEAVMLAMARNKDVGLKKADVTKYEQVFGNLDATDFESDYKAKNAAEFIETVKAAQIASGDKNAKYLSGITRDEETGNLTRLSDKNIHELVERDFMMKTSAQLNSEVTPIVFNGSLDENQNPNNVYMVDVMKGIMAKHQTDEALSAMSTTTRDTLAGLTKDLLAMKDKYGIEVGSELEKNLQDYYVRLKATYKNRDIKTDSSLPITLSSGKQIQNQEAAAAYDEIITNKDVTLRNRADELIEKSSGVATKKAIVGTEELSAIDKSVEDKLITPVGINKRKRKDARKVYDAKNRARKGVNSAADADTILNPLKSFYGSIKSEAFSREFSNIPGRSKTGQYNPATNKEYEFSELLENSTVGKLYAELKKQLEDIKSANRAADSEEQRLIENNLTRLIAYMERPIEVIGTDKMTPILRKRGSREKRVQMRQTNTMSVGSLRNLIGQIQTETDKATRQKQFARGSQLLENTIRLNETYNFDPKYIEELDRLNKRYGYLERVTSDESFDKAHVESAIKHLNEQLDFLEEMYKPQKKI